MSRTDKTDPFWVDRWWEPDHGRHCINGISKYGHIPCDLPDEPPMKGIDQVNCCARLSQRTTRCAWEPDTPPYYSKTGPKTYGRPRSVQTYEREFEGGIRTAWRNVRQELLATHREDLDDVELPDPRHCHFALWNMW